MILVAIHHTQPTDGSRAPALAAALGKTAYDVRARVLAPGPCVVTVTKDPAQARATEDALRAAGFSTLVRDSAGLDRPERRFDLRSFALEPEGWRLVNRAGREVVVPYGAVRVLIVGMGVVTTTETEVVTKKKRSLGRAVMTGGLSTKKKVKHRVAHTLQARERFLHAYTAAGGVVVARETAVDYGGLGAPRTQPTERPAQQATRAADFERLVAALRQRAPRAAFDDRLLTVPGQRQLLGPALDPEAHADLASALLAAYLLL